MTDMAGPVAELRAEFDDLEALLAGLTSEQWLAPTPAEGWDIRDQVSHLADTNEICIDTITGGPRPLNEFARSFDSPEAFTEAGCERGRTMEPTGVLSWWNSSARGVCQALETLEPAARIPWGLGMSARMMVTARLMEHWAHSLDIRATIGLGPNVSPRLRSIAFLVLKSVPYALGVAGVEAPPGSLRAELAYDEQTWRLGPDDAGSVITGDALEFCILGVQRTSIDKVQTLRADGALAEAALPNLRAFL
jgi:uncharacterized protein (TIGR03084 family)